MRVNRRETPEGRCRSIALPPHQKALRRPRGRWSFRRCGATPGSGRRSGPPSRKLLAVDRILGRRVEVHLRKVELAAEHRVRATAVFVNWKLWPVFNGVSRAFFNVDGNTIVEDGHRRHVVRFDVDWRRVRSRTLEPMPASPSERRRPGSGQYPRNTCKMRRNRLRHRNRCERPSLLSRKCHAMPSANAMSRRNVDRCGQRSGIVNQRKAQGAGNSDHDEACHQRLGEYWRFFLWRKGLVQARVVMNMAMDGRDRALVGTCKLRRDLASDSDTHKTYGTSVVYKYRPFP